MPRKPDLSFMANHLGDLLGLMKGRMRSERSPTKSKGIIFRSITTFFYSNTIIYDHE